MIRPSAMLLAAAAMLLPAATVTAPAAPGNEPVPPNAQMAVSRALEFLAARQADSGAFPTQGLRESTAVTSLAAMAFMAAGHTPGQGPYGEHLNRAIDWVIARQKPSGLLSATSDMHTMYDHGISTVMLCEAYGMVDAPRQQKIEVAVGKAIKLILDAQKVRKSPDEQGGWRYHQTSTDSDLSVTGWQLMALRGAANIGAAVPKDALDAGVDYVRRRATPSGGFAYTGQGRTTSALTGTGIVSLELLGKHHTREALAGGDYLVRQADRRDAFYFYMVYYNAQAANLLGGRYWDGIFKPIREALVNAQRRDGSWSSDGAEQSAGDAYSTSMAVLALTVQYRYLPLYQR